MSENEKTWTLAEVERQECANDELERKAEKLKAEEAELTRRIAEAQVAGQDTVGLKAERDEARALRADIEETLPLVRRIVAERREAAHKGEAGWRLTAISRAHGSLRTQYLDGFAKLHKKVHELLEEVEKENALFTKLVALETEVLVLRDRWTDLPEPAVERVPPPAQQEQAVAALERAVRARQSLSNPRALPRRLVDVDERTADRLRGSVAGTPTGEILAQAGAPQDHTARHEAAQQERRAAQDAERQAERDRADDFLRQKLAGGPVLRDKVVAAAKKAGIVIGGPGGATLVAARERLHVVTVLPVVERRIASAPGRSTERGADETVVLWALPGGFDEESFSEYRGGSSIPAGAMRF